MLSLTHLLPVILRVLFGCLTSSGLLLLILRREYGTLAHALVFGGLACLMTSGCIVAADGAQTVVSLAVYASLLACDYLFISKSVANPHLFLVPALLSGIGVSIAFDTSPWSAVRHASVVLAGAIVCLALLIVSQRRIVRIGSPFNACLVSTVLLCALPLIPGLGAGIYRLSQWAQVGPVVFCPSEFAKVTLLVALSGFFALNAQHLHKLNVKALLPAFATFYLVLCLETLVRDLATIVVLFAFFASMLFLCSGRSGVKYVIALLVCGIVFVLFAAFAFPHVASRINAWLSPYADPQGAGYQYITSIEAMTSGGFIGKGLHLGSLFYLAPMVSSDYVFVAIVEELGEMGGAVIILSIIAFSFTAARTAMDFPKHSFERNLTIGGGCLVFWQTFIAVGSAVGIVPPMGIGLPFVSLGGSSMLGFFCLVGLMGSCTFLEDVQPEGMAITPHLFPQSNHDNNGSQAGMADGISEA